MIKLKDLSCMKQIRGDVDLGNLYLKELPSILTNVSVVGYFYCHGNKLTSLVGAPSSVVGNFYCDNNNLTSLAGAPASVGGYFNCSGNDIQFTIEQVRAVCNVKGTIRV